MMVMIRGFSTLGNPNIIYHIFYLLWGRGGNPANQKGNKKIKICSYWKYMEREFDHAGNVETSIPKVPIPSGEIPNHQFSAELIDGLINLKYMI